MLSKTAEYALRLVIALAEADSEEAVPCRELATRAVVPEEYAVQILCHLSRRKIVAGQRGRVGGYRLAGPPDQLTLLEVVNAVQPIERITSCPLGFSEHRHALCPLHQCIDDVLAYLEERLAGATVQSLIDLKSNDGLCRRMGGKSPRVPKVQPVGIDRTSPAKQTGNKSVTGSAKKDGKSRKSSRSGDGASRRTESGSRSSRKPRRRKH